MNLEQNFINILFGILFVFVLLNLIVCSLLYLFYSKKTYRFLSIYWLGVLIVFVVQSQFQSNELHIMLAAGTSFFPLAILAQVVFDSFKQSFPFYRHLFIFLLSYPLMIFLYKQGYGFTLSSLPGGLAISSPLLHALYLLVIKNWQQSTVLQKMLVLPYLAFIIHIFNFCFFRMDENAQLWGWSVSFAIYQLLGILLPAFVLEETHRTENSRLFDLVQDKTQELILSNGKLETSIREKNALFRVLIHDISNPLTSLIDQIDRLRANTLEQKNLPILAKAEQLTNHLCLIINHLKDVEGRKSGKISTQLAPVSVINSITKILEIFDFALLKKELTVQIINKTAEKDPHVLADETILASSVFSNIISNSIKFSLLRGFILISIEDFDDLYYKITFKDNGIGMKEKDLLKVFQDNTPTTHLGTSLERGIGFGMPIVKMYVESFSGKVEIHSTSIDLDLATHGTEVFIFLQKADYMQLHQVPTLDTENLPSGYLN